MSDSDLLKGTHAATDSTLAREAAAEELQRLRAIDAAARNLVKAKGRYHTEQAYKALAALLANTEGQRP